LAAVGVTFLFVVAVNRVLRSKGFFNENIKEPSLLLLLDLVALGTICDVVPLQGLNRAFAFQGLKILGQRRNLGLAALADIAKIDQRPTAYHAGFIFGPRINAGGRIGKSSSGTELLTQQNSAQASAIAEMLDSLNRERQELETAILEEAQAKIIDQNDDKPMVIVSGEGWHPGVIGIVASRLKDRFARPVMVIAMDGQIGKGSGRSVKGVDLGAVVIAARQKGLLEGGGGHQMAAGLTVTRDRLEELAFFMQSQVMRQLPPEGLIRRLRADGVLTVDSIDFQLVQSLERLEPFGAGNEEPRIVVSRARIDKADIVGEKHVRCFLSGSGGQRLKGIAFKSMHNELGPFLLSHQGQLVHLCGKVRKDTWQGNQQLQLFIDDATKILHIE
jgi:single-stranded-DNA-specific exonuclease